MQMQKGQPTSNLLAPLTSQPWDLRDGHPPIVGEPAVGKVDVVPPLTVGDVFVECQRHFHADGMWLRGFLGFPTD
jgi:hypothetical protein